MVFKGVNPRAHRFQAAVHFPVLFFLREDIVRPAFLVIGFEGGPFLTEAVLVQPLDLGDLVDAAFKALGDLIQGALNEDRFRQEWTTFKSDDQKRWSNYILSQEEQHREMNRSLEGMGARIDTLEDHLETLQENLQQLGRDDVKRMMASLNALRDSIETYNTIFKD